MIAKLFIFLLVLYQKYLSPLIGPNCRYHPTCSEYAVEALKRFGILRGGWLVIIRISKCHPWGGSGLDPVPKKTKRYRKGSQWIF